MQKKEDVYEILQLSGYHKTISTYKTILNYIDGLMSGQFCDPLSPDYKAMREKSTPSFIPHYHFIAMNHDA